MFIVNHECLTLVLNCMDETERLESEFMIIGSFTYVERPRKLYICDYVYKRLGWKVWRFWLK